MFLRAKTRKKDGKLHHYFSVVENQRVRGGRVVQRHVLYLGEINSSQELAWRKSIEVLDEGGKGHRTLALFPEDHCEGLLPDESVVRLKLSQLRLERPRQWGGCWLALQLWRELEMDRVIDEHVLYDCHDLLLEHKTALFDHLVGRWRDLFNVSFDVLLYDLTSTYFE